MTTTPDSIPALPAIRFTDLTQVKAIIAAVRQTGVSAAAWTIPDAAAIAGPAWFHALFTQALAVPPQPPPGGAPTHRKSGAFHLVLDCGDSAGHAVEALHLGVRCLHFGGPAGTRAKLNSIAEQTGAWMVAAPTGPELDLSTLPVLQQSDDDHLARTCSEWLERQLTA